MTTHPNENTQSGDEVFQESISDIPGCNPPGTE